MGGAEGSHILHSWVGGEVLMGVQRLALGQAQRLVSLQEGTQSYSI